MKRIEIDSKFYRRRRGVLVEIPAQWVGRTVTSQTIAKRPSKAPHKRRKEMKFGREAFRCEIRETED